MYSGSPRVKYTGGRVKLGSRIVLAHVPEQGAQVQEQVQLQDETGEYWFPIGHRLTSRDWARIVRVLGFVVAGALIIWSLL